MSAADVERAYSRAARGYKDVEPPVKPLRRNTCYVTAWKLATKNPYLTYVEGTATAPDGDRYPHAWLVRNGRVYDPTWGNQGRNYRGVPINPAYVRRLATTKWEPGDGGVATMLRSFPDDITEAIAGKSPSPPTSPRDHAHSERAATMRPSAKLFHSVAG